MERHVELNKTIQENIQFFWNNNPLVLDYELETAILWNGFKVWCTQNCLENFDNLERSFVEEAINNNYANWVNYGDR